MIACTPLWIVAVVAAASAAAGVLVSFSLLALALIAARRRFARPRAEGPA